MAIYLKRSTFGLSYINRSQTVTKFGLASGIITSALSWQRHYPMIFQISYLTRGYVHVGNQTLDWACIGIVSWVFLDEADCPMHAMPFWNTRVLVPASWPGVDLNQIKISNSARAHGLLPACIGLSDRYRSDKISKTNGCLTRLYTIND